MRKPAQPVLHDMLEAIQSLKSLGIGCALLLLFPQRIVELLMAIKKAKDMMRHVPLRWIWSKIG